MSLEVIHTNKARPGLNAGSYPTPKLSQGDYTAVPSTAAATAGFNLSKAKLQKQYGGPEFTSPLIPDNNFQAAQKTDSHKFSGTLDLLFGRKEQSLNVIDTKLSRGVSIFKHNNKYQLPHKDNLFGNRLANRDYIKDLESLQQQFFGK